jgi:hypothetical protein
MARRVSNLGETSGKAVSREWVSVAVKKSLCWKRTLSVTRLRDVWWRRNCPNILAPRKNTLYQLVGRFRDTGSVVGRRGSGTPKVVTLELVSDVHLRLLRSPQKSVRRLSQQMGASRESNPKALKV